MEIPFPQIDVVLTFNRYKNQKILKLKILLKNLEKVFNLDINLNYYSIETHSVN